METITSENLLENFTALPPEAQKEAAHFIEFLKTRYKSVKAKSDDKVEDEPFIGIWRDHDDMQNSSEWVRGLREKDWS
uniref:DUF2281 domain-containing protein n=1 Tax=uncultured Thiotrichaceae bacterium TaxID=298394 RepID=A0A6S6UBC6_9GAMM|nr:MAG: Unknown protein [uncultured Thiotrichaceae bacterium]